MLLSDLYDLVIKEAGQYVSDRIELDLKDFKNIVKFHVLPFIGKYKPYVKVYQLNMLASPYTFVDPIPDWVSDVSPTLSTIDVSVLSVIPFMFRQERRTHLWYYDKPKLYSLILGQIMVQACFIPYLSYIEPLQSGMEEDYEIQRISDDASLSIIRLTTGFVLSSIGRARRAVNFSDSPMTFDADQLVSDGEGIIKDVMEELKKEQYWWLGAT